MKFWLPFSLFVTLIVVFAFQLGDDPSELPSARLNQSFPAFELPSLENTDTLLNEKALIGEMALVNIWGSWCLSCQIEHPVLMQLQEDYQIPIYGINYKDSRPAAKKWLNTLGNPYRLNIYDKEGQLPIDLGVYGTPETFLIDEEGRILERHVGPISGEVWSQKFESFFKEQP